MRRKLFAHDSDLFDFGKKKRAARNECKFIRFEQMKSEKYGAE